MFIYPFKPHRCPQRAGLCARHKHLWVTLCSTAGNAQRGRGPGISRTRDGPRAADLPFDAGKPAQGPDADPQQAHVLPPTIRNVFWICFRIYNNLPEVKKKKEEQKKRVILQSNRLRAEVFKKVMAWLPAQGTGLRAGACVILKQVRRSGADSEFTALSSTSLATPGPAPSEECSLAAGYPAGLPQTRDDLMTSSTG